MNLSVEQLRENNLSSMIIFMMGIFGMTVNLHVILALKKTNTFGYAFGRICMSHTVANFANAFIFACYVAPITVLNSELHKHYIGMRAGQALLLFYYASVLSHLLTAINRCIVMFFPVKVDQILTKRVTDVTIVLLWGIAICQVMPYFSSACVFEYHTEIFTFQFEKSFCGLIVGKYLDYYFSITMIGIIGALDFLTIVKIRLLNKTNQVAVDAEQRRRKEIRFFFQALCQGFLFMTELISFFYISTHFENKWIRFGFTTCAWMAVHIIDGLIVIGFNKDIRSFRISPCSANQLTLYVRSSINATSASTGSVSRN
ncbi:hypothetical protein L596_012520 [Steinernema carpocapsae]|uniref:7TM GPCR serpentine receptor class x (Srx) domain-containing protein n=1 Tax=Steinernema carpocapsae TaxID=34508 RepID=A0A4U5NXJ0_STECR|nr:hypothetical protein L596_012520 [Steinernema carpocapsae]